MSFIKNIQKSGKYDLGVQGTQESPIYAFFRNGTIQDGSMVIYKLPDGLYEMRYVISIAPITGDHLQAVSFAYKETTALQVINYPDLFGPIGHVLIGHMVNPSFIAVVKASEDILHRVYLLLSAAHRVMNNNQLPEISYGLLN